MKKNTLLFITILFTLQIAKSQNTCLNATNYYSANNVPIPIPGTISPVGPYLGCLSLTERQVWFYIPVCHTASSVHLELNIGGVNQTISLTDSVGIFIYGPFAQKVINCADLTASKNIQCLQYNMVSPNVYLNLPVTLDEGNYYYILLTFTPSVLLSSVSYSGFPVFGCYECNNQPSVLYQNNLCLVSVDTATNKCALTWEEFPGANLFGYEIWRETSLTGVFDSLTTISVDSLSTYVDLTSSPAQRNYTYATRPVDSCGNTLYQIQQSQGVTSVHLISFSGGNNQAQLIWNNIYSSNSFLPQYYIYRNSNSTGWQLIDSIGVTLPTITYTDIFAPAGVNLYTVELRKLNPCIPMRVATSTTAYQSAFSNVSIANVTTGAEELTNSGRISIYPNPAKDKFTIDLNYLSMSAVDISISDMKGIKCFDLKNVSEKTLAIERKNWKPGVYVVEIKGDKVYRSKLVIQ